MRRLAVALLASLALPGAAAAGTVETVDIPSRFVDESKANFNEGGALKAKVLLPDGYEPERAYPLLLLLHGAGDTFESWASPQKGDIVQTAAGLDAIVVMPDGATGFYTNWFNGGEYGDPRWERYMLEEVLGFVRSHYRIRPERRYHAIAGLSMGGFGASFLGGRVPGYFGSVAVFSGFVEHQRPEVSEGGLQAVAGVEYDTIFGPPDGFYATGHNPTKLAANLRRSRVFVATGDGTVDPALGASSPAAAAAGGVVEVEIRAQNEAFVAALRQADVPVTYDPHAGVHDWPYWKRDLKAAIAWGLFEPPPSPSDWENTTVAQAGNIFGVGYEFAEPPPNLVRLERSGDKLAVDGPRVPITVSTAGGCELEGTLPLELTLPRRPCAALKIRVEPLIVRAGRRVTLRIRTRPGATVKADGRRAVADVQGRARLRVRYERPGVRLIRGRARNRLPGTASVTVFP